MRDEIKVPVVYVSHAVEEVVRLADTVALMSAGEVVAQAPPKKSWAVDPHTARSRRGGDRSKVIEQDCIRFATSRSTEVH